VAHCLTSLADTYAVAAHQRLCSLARESRLSTWATPALADIFDVINQDAGNGHSL